MNDDVERAGLTVLVSTRIYPTSGRATRSRADAAAVALAQMALGDRSEPRLCTVGDMPESVMRDYLAQGVGRIVRLRHRNDGGEGDVVAALEGACRDGGPVLAGPRAESGFGSGLLPYALARCLQWPVINEVVDLLREPDGGWRVVQALPRGDRHSWRLERGVAAVLVTSTRLEQREDLPRRYSWVAAQAGHIVEAAVGTSRPAQGKGAAWNLEPARKQRRPLAPVSTESGAARMARATGSADSGRKGGTVIREGSVTEKAQLLLDHLCKLSLVRPPG